MPPPARGRSRRFVEFSTANIRNKNTREAYRRNITVLLTWCDTEAGMALDMIEPMVVAAYVEKLLKDGLSKPTVKQHLAAIRMMFDWMVTGGILAVNPASAVRGPKYGRVSSIRGRRLWTSSAWSRGLARSAMC